jgi:hypothetical protein
MYTKSITNLTKAQKAVLRTGMKRILINELEPTKKSLENEVKSYLKEVNPYSIKYKDGAVKVPSEVLERVYNLRKFYVGSIIEKNKGTERYELGYVTNVSYSCNEQTGKFYYHFILGTSNEKGEFKPTTWANTVGLNCNLDPNYQRSLFIKFFEIECNNSKNQ